MSAVSLRRALCGALLLCLGVLLAATAQADPEPHHDLPEAVTLERALALLRDRSPLASASEARIDVAAAERVGAGVWPNPTLSYGGLALASGVNTGSVWQHQITLEQPLLLFGQAGAREDLADLNVDAERARVAAGLEERALAVRQEFATLVARQERARVLQESLAELQRLEKIVRGRQAAGDRSVYDVTRVALEASTLRSEVRIAEADVDDASGRLAALLGFPGWRPRAEGSLEPRDLSDSVERLWETALRQRPSIAAARAEEAAARGALTVARRERLPVPSAAIGTLLTQEDNSASVYFGFSIPLPIFDRGQGPIASAKAAIEAEAREVDAEVAEARAELERALALYQRQRSIVREIEQEQIGVIPTLEKMAEDAYQGGGVAVLELIDAFRSVKEVRLNYLEQRAALRLAEEALIAAAGLEPVAAAGQAR